MSLYLYGISCIVFPGLVGLLFLYYRQRTSRRLPPGPAFSCFGRLYGRSADGSLKLIEMRKKYGDVFCIRVMGTLCIYLNTHEKIRQFFVTNGDVMSGRIDIRIMKLRFGSARGLVMNDGASWHENRSFVLNGLRDFGFGRAGTDQIVQSELQHLIDACIARNGHPFDPQLVLNEATCNVICLIVFGERCGSEQNFVELFSKVQENILITNQVHDQLLMFLFRYAKRLPAFFIAVMLKHMDYIRSYLEAKVIQHKQRFNGEVKDLVDCYLKKVQEQESQSTESIFNELELYAIITDLFIGGMETTATTLRWALMLMVHSPEVQKRVQDEIDEVLNGRLPNSADRKDLRYTDAVVMEIQRFATLMPLGGIHHRCIRDVTIDGYDIPKDCMVYANTFAAHRDEKIWPDPFNFNPENFYDAQLKSVKNTEYLIPFGVGRRMCLGEALAKQELFVVFTGLMQNFDVLAPDSGTFLSSDDCLFGNLRTLPAFQVILKQRCAK